MVLNFSWAYSWSLQLQSLMDYFLMLSKLQRSNLSSRKAWKSTHLITGLYRYCHFVTHDQTIGLITFQRITWYVTRFRTDSSTNLCFSFLVDKILKGFDGLRILVCNGVTHNLPAFLRHPFLYSTCTPPLH